MILKINRIKNLGMVLTDYTWDANLPDFKSFNLFYGWNGSGKTTLSRLFDAVEGIPIHGLEYEIQDDESRRYKQGDVFPRSIRVFNQDYIQRNVEVLQGRANSISILLGAENKTLLEKIETDKKLLNGDPDDQRKPGIAFKLAECLNEKKEKNVDRGKTFTEIARTIGAAIGGNALRNYRKQQAEEDFLSLNAKAELENRNLEELLTSVKQVSLPTLKLPALPKVRVHGHEEVDLVTFLKRTRNKTEALLLKAVQSDAILRLVTHADLSLWIEEGIRLHDKYASHNCEYCLQTIPASRKMQLASHFNEADAELKKDLDSVHKNLNNVISLINSVELPDAVRLYTESREALESARSAFEAEKEQVVSYLGKLIEELKRKKNKTTESMILETQVQGENLVVRLGKVNEVIQEHNNITAHFEQIKAIATSRLKQHYLSTIYDDVKSLDGDIVRLQVESDLLRKEVESIRERITKNMASISSEHKACDEINNKLCTFLGHRELRFVPRMGKKQFENETAKEVVVGYNIQRGDAPAKHLSEGEKTAIAFVYFTVHLRDQSFNLHNGIVLVDDPISSLDSNSLYQAFSFLKNAVKDCKQVFVLTHNFDFLRLIINWRKRAGGAGYYMIKNCFPNDARCAYIDKMDRELHKYESEYHYLFKLLCQMKSEQDGTISKAYLVPNIARKVWDAFLAFRVPSGDSPYHKMEELKNVGFDPQKLDAIYKFINDQSHITGSGFDPSLVPEAKKVLDEIFEMMAEISPEHYEILLRSVTDA